RETMFAQGAVQFADMSVIARFDGADGVDRGDIRSAESAIVFDILDARAARRDDAREFGKTARPVTDHRGETRDAAIAHKALFDDAAEDRRVDVAAAGDEHDFLAAQFRQQPGHQRSEWRHGRTFHDGLFHFHHAEDRERDPILADFHHAIDATANKRKR